MKARNIQFSRIRITPYPAELLVPIFHSFKAGIAGTISRFKYISNNLKWARPILPPKYVTLCDFCGIIPAKYCVFVRTMYWSVFKLSRKSANSAKLNNLNFHPLQVVSRYRHPQLRVAYIEQQKEKDDIVGRRKYSFPPFCFAYFKRFSLIFYGDTMQETFSHCWSATVGF